MLKSFSQSKACQHTLDALRRSHAIAEFDVNGNLLDANAGLLSLLDMRLEDVQGKAAGAWLEPGFAKSAGCKQLWESIGRGEPQSAEIKCRGKDGKDVWLQVDFTPVRSPSGQWLKTVMLARDCTQVHELMEEMADLRVRASITDMTSIVSEADPKGDIITINEKFCEVSKYSRDELIGKQREESERALRTECIATGSADH